MGLKKTPSTEFHREVDWDYYFNLPLTEKNKIYKDIAVDLYKVSFNRAHELGDANKGRNFFHFKRMLELRDLGVRKIEEGDDENLDFLSKIAHYHKLYTKNHLGKYRKNDVYKRTNYKVSLVFKERKLIYV